MLLCFLPGINIQAQNTDETPADSPAIDSIASDSVSTPAVDSAAAIDDSTMISLDSLGIDTTTTVEIPPLPPPPQLLDSLIHYFARHEYRFDVQQADLYPRDAAGFLYHEASYFALTSLETPLRTTVAPFGMPGDRMTVRSGNNELAPYDRTIPGDGLIDFNDIITGDVARAAIVEGPLAGYNSLSGALSLLYLEPFRIPEGPAVTKFTVERGAFGYAYTRGRVARMLTPDLGFAFSTDYRKGDGFVSNVDDDSYNIKARLFRRFNYRTTLDASVGVYRRKGGYLSYRRLRRDEQYAVSITRQEFFGGVLTGRYNLNLSRSADITKTIRPRDTYTDLSYLLARNGGLYQASIRFGKEQFYINRYFATRYYGYGDLSGMIDLQGGRLFFFGRLRDAELQDIAVEAAGGYSRRIGQRWQVTVSSGYLSGWPDLTDLYLPEGTLGLYNERGNTDLKAEKKLTGNATIQFITDKFEISTSFNAGTAKDLIYYEQTFDQYPSVEITPENDKVTFADANISGSFHDLWWFYGKASATARRIDSDRYGDKTPYSPRWQVYGQLGLKRYIEKYNVHVRLFGDITYFERPLSYTLQELNTTAMVDWGVNATLKDFTFYYMMHNALSQYQERPEGYSYTGWFQSWGINWNFLD